MQRPKDTEEPAGAENPPAAPAPRAPEFWRRIDWPNVSVVIALLTMFGSGLWWAIDDVDGDVVKLSERMDGELRDLRSDISVVRGDVKTLSGDVVKLSERMDGELRDIRNEIGVVRGDVVKLSERMDRELRDLRNDISVVRGDVKTLSGDVQYIKGQLDGIRNESASHAAGTPVAASPRGPSHAATGG